MAISEADNSINFYSYLNKDNEKPNSRVETQEGGVPTMDKAPKKDKGRCYWVFCSDEYGSLRDIINALSEHGNCGHSFEVIVDAGEKGEEKFFWDGDGSDRINAVIDCSDKDDDALLRILLDTLSDARRSIWKASKEAESWEKPLTEEEKTAKLKEVEHQISLCLRGCQYNDEKAHALDVILRNLNYKLAQLDKGESSSIEDMKDFLAQCKKLAEEGLNAPAFRRDKAD